ncbi:phosphotransferase enzyme family protein [Nonomuraea polychroma]|uniref:phosphotransferase enzyme family protein n=1 Tax=Nonomuraea polychroma TaxID=46176 RepID=UPI003D8D66DB
MFDADAALRAVHEAARTAGLVSHGATLLGPVGDNAVFVLPAEHVVARVAWGPAATPRVERELRVAAWLHEQGLPAVRVVASVPGQPLLCDGRLVTFWEEIASPQQADTAAMGDVLRRLHALPAPPEGLLETFDPFVRQREHIAAADGVDDSDRGFLLELLADLEAAYGRLPFTLPRSPIHGDPHRKNLVRAADGRVILLDLERFSFGPPEWDVIVPVVYQRVGWYSAAEVDQFVAAYGWDVTRWDGCETLMRVRQLRMTAWLASRTGREPRLIPEVRRRIASLRDPAVRHPWTPGT